MPSEPSDPTVVRSLAVTTGDVVAALEVNRTSDDHATLRVTPPFSARMRARLHVDRSGGQQSGETSTHRTGVAGDAGESGDGGETAGYSQHEGTVGGGDGHGGEPLYVEPAQLLTDPPEYPRPADTRAELLSDPETAYTVERHHEHHERAVREWRASVPGCIREQFPLDTPAGPVEVTVRTLESDLL